MADDSLFGLTDVQDKVSEAVDQGDSVVTQGVIMDVSKSIPDPDYNIQPTPEDMKKIKARIDAGAGKSPIMIIVNPVEEVSMRNILNLYLKYRKVMHCAVKYKPKTNTFDIEVVVSKHNMAVTPKPDYEPSDSSIIGETVDGLGLSDEDLNMTKSIMHAVYNKDHLMEVPRFEFIDNPPNKYTLIASPINNMTASFYQYLTRIHPTIIENIICRTSVISDKKPPTADNLAPCIEITCNRVVPTDQMSRKISRSHHQDEDDAEPPRKKRFFGIF